MDQATQPLKKSSQKSASVSPSPIVPKPSRGLPLLAAARHADELTENRSLQVLAAMMAFSAGDFRARLPTDWSGVDGRIAEAFNRTIGNAARITDEAARLSTTVGKEGRLSQRMAARRGRWLGRAGRFAQHADRRPGAADHRHRPHHRRRGQG